MHEELSISIKKNCEEGRKMGERLNVNIEKKIGKKLLSKKSCLKKSISHYFFFPSTFFFFLSNIIMLQSKTNFGKVNMMPSILK
jgi:hypothetical protein